MQGAIGEARRAGSPGDTHGLQALGCGKQRSGCCEEILHGCPSPLICNEQLRSEGAGFFWFGFGFFLLGFVLWPRALGDSCLLLRGLLPHRDTAPLTNRLRARPGLLTAAGCGAILC